MLRRLRAAHFADLTGANTSLTLPISDRLVTQIIAENLPPSSPVSELELRALEGDQFTVHVRLAKAAFLPAFRIRLVIEQQPELPSAPILVLRIASEGIGAFAGMAKGFLKTLPAGVRLEGDKLSVELATILARYDLGDALEYLTRLELKTEPGRIILVANAAVP